MQALDRVLLSGWYVIPHWHLRATRIAWWDRYARPSVPIRPGLAMDTWWFDAGHAAITDAARRAR